MSNSAENFSNYSSILPVDFIDCVVLNFSEPCEVSKSKLRQLAENVQTNVDFLFCGIRTTKETQIYKKNVLSLDKHEFRSDVANSYLMMERISKFPFYGFVFFGLVQDILIGEALPLIKELRIMYPYIRVGHITRLRFEPNGKILCIDISVREPIIISSDFTDTENTKP